MGRQYTAKLDHTKKNGDCFFDAVAKAFPLQASER
eukprot:gene6120-6688_t